MRAFCRTAVHNEDAVSLLDPNWLKTNAFSSIWLSCCEDVWGLRKRITIFKSQLHVPGHQFELTWLFKCEVCSANYSATLCQEKLPQLCFTANYTVRAWLCRFSHVVIWFPGRFDVFLKRNTWGKWSELGFCCASPDLFHSLSLSHSSQKCVYRVWNQTIPLDFKLDGFPTPFHRQADQKEAVSLFSLKISVSANFMNVVLCLVQLTVLTTFGHFELLATVKFSIIQKEGQSDLWFLSLFSFHI